MSGPQEALIRDACEALAEACPVMAKAYQEIGVPGWRAAPAEYATLCRLVTHQQISTTAANAIWSRVTTRFNPLTPEAVLTAPEGALAACGLSRPKVAHLTSIAHALTNGELDLAAIVDAPFEEAKASLVSVKGIGPWTAEVFLLYAAGALDAFPTADIGLTESHRLLSGAEERPDAKTFQILGEAWRPYRGVAAHLLWGWLNQKRAEEGRSSSQA